MPISDEEAYKQGKRIAADMMRGQYDPAKDYSDNPSSTKDAKPRWLIILVIVALIAGAVYWFFWT